MDYSRFEDKTPKELSYFVAATTQEVGLYISLEWSRVMQWRRYVEQREGCKIGVPFILNPELFWNIRGWCSLNLRAGRHCEVYFKSNVILELIQSLRDICSFTEHGENFKYERSLYMSKSFDSK